jgi:tetratricopeptide (TPR) repeat protein
MLTDDVAGKPGPGVTENDLANAYPSAIADYEAASQNARTSEMRQISELDLAFLSGNWRGLSGRVERTLAEPGCLDANWLSTIADVLGFADQYRDRAEKILACDPLRSLSWFNAARATFWAGDKVEALRLAREGVQTAPGSWITMTLIRTLIANGLYEEASHEIENRVQDDELALTLGALIFAHQGDRQHFEPLVEQYYANPAFGGFWEIALSAWGGQRETANRKAAEMDKHHFGPVAMWQMTHWCACGAPWDLEATPNFAAKIKEGNVTWPPPSPMSFPLKDW